MPGTTNGLNLVVDPGLAGTGFALFAEPNLVLACSTVVTIPGRDGARLLTITNHLRAIIAGNPPAEASIEELFMGRNATSAVGVAQARGAILNVLEECGVPVFEYKPSQVKVILTGYGNAYQSQVGLNILSAASLEVLKRAIMNEDAAPIRRASGVGPRTAAKVIIEIKPRLDAVAALDAVPRAAAAAGDGAVPKAVEAALRNLGFSSQEARSGIEAVDWESSPGTQEALATALKALGRQ